MTKTQMTKAIQGHDEITLLVEAMRTAVANGDDAILALIEDMTTAAKADAVDDVIVDLKSEGYTEAASYIKVNY